MAILDQHQEQPIEEILQDLKPRIEHVFSRFRIPPLEAEDVLQKTLLTYIYKRNSILDAERWLMGTLRNWCLLYWRDRRSRLYTSVDRALLESVVEADASPQGRGELLRDLNTALAKVPSRYRSLLWTRYKPDMGPSKAVVGPGRETSGIRKLTERCLAALTRSMLGGERVEEGCDD